MRATELPATLRRIVIGVLAAIGAAVVLLCALPVSSTVAHSLSGGFNDPSGDILVVLCGAAPHDGIISPEDYTRAVYALRAWRATPFRTVLIAGRNGAALRNFLVAQGIPSAAVVLEERSTSTRENAVFSSRMLAGTRGPIVLLTSDYHMYRARRAFARAGIEVLPHPAPDALKMSSQWYNRPGVFALEMVEMVKIGAYRWRGWI